MKYINSKKAFTMIEVVFVIMILGIVVSIGSEIIADVYRSYILERATHRSSIKTELAATQVANRLSYSIPATVIGRKSTDGSYRSISNLDSSDYDILEWIGYDNDSFSSKITPGWSGFIDLDASSATQLKSNGSDIGTADAIITNLGGSGIGDAGLFFAGQYNADNIGYNGDTSGVVTVADSSDNDIFDVNLSSGTTISEHYKLAWSAYALKPQDNGNGSFDLVLHYNYRPWKGESLDDGLTQVLVKNVTVFKFVGSDNTIRFKICQRERIANDKNITICKEKAVIR